MYCNYVFLLFVWFLALGLCHLVGARMVLTVKTLTSHNEIIALLLLRLVASITFTEFFSGPLITNANARICNVNAPIYNTNVGVDNFCVCVCVAIWHIGVLISRVGIVHWPTRWTTHCKHIVLCYA